MSQRTSHKHRLQLASQFSNKQHKKEQEFKVVSPVCSSIKPEIEQFFSFADHFSRTVRRESQDLFGMPAVQHVPEADGAVPGDARQHRACGTETQTAYRALMTTKDLHVHTHTHKHTHRCQINYNITTLYPSQTIIYFNRHVAWAGCLGKRAKTRPVEGLLF